MAEYITYDDDLCLQKTAPSLETLDFLRGDKMDAVAPGKVHVFYFCAKYYKGGQFVSDEMSELSEKYPDVAFIGVSGDAEREQVEKLLTKRVVCENTGRELKNSLPYFCFDANGVVRRSFSERMGGEAVSIPQGFIVNQEGKIVWRQVFSQNILISQTDFESQLKHIIQNEPLESHGMKPKVECGDAEEAEMDDMSLF